MSVVSNQILPVQTNVQTEERPPRKEKRKRVETFHEAEDRYIMEDRKHSKAERYTTDLLEIPGMAFDVSVPDPKERIQVYIDAYRKSDPANHQGFDEVFMREHISVVSATRSADKAAAVFEMKAAPVFTNRMGNMHGGAVAMIHDMCTTMTAAPLAKKEFWWFGGVSRTLSITYLRPVRKDMELSIECEVLQQGMRLSTIRSQMRNKKTGALLSVAEHNKASIDFVETTGRL
ncbi:uncharacterized protein Z518_00284 [Rhinocladiella mackenziei CBS 650.93]|uniref:Thioesterase domain-containing protein n=1 Tax=Rhinocladiella mackenziei CBS 650.93 TaxID=1442369 RepID=A0A0D2JIF4_9EURO|nr:uncharacterized protein Z518_00284 [Rhinocladiella mackenziei CBS 650.93]KIX09205.1 hypothetical protein Z518_00284 [Rhinocladiella mackenziei CBS 650.93]